MRRVRLIESCSLEEKEKLSNELEVTLKGADDTEYKMKFNFLPIEDSLLRLFA